MNSYVLDPMEDGFHEPLIDEIQEGQIDQHMLDTLCHVAEIRTYPPETALTHQGVCENTFYVIEAGQAEVIRLMDNGEEQVLNTLGPLHSFGEMALLDARPRLATVKTTMETTVLEITGERFAQLLVSDPDIALYISRQILANLRTLDHLAIRNLFNKNLELQEAYKNLQAAQAELVEKERLEREMEMAAEMQRSLLPAHLPQFPDFQFASYLEPARQVGGDLFDVRVIDDEHVAILIADVADKGMHAALLMAVTRTLFYQESQRSLSPAAVAGQVHKGLLAIGGSGNGYGIDAFVTAFYGVLHRPSGRLVYVRAAQDRPLLLRSGEEPYPLPGDGRFLGMIETLTLAEQTVELKPGDILLLYSDGVTDAHNENGEPYSKERLTASLSAWPGGEAQELIRYIVQNLEDWRGDAAAFDDTTLLVVSAVATPT